MSLAYTTPTHRAAAHASASRRAAPTHAKDLCNLDTVAAWSTITINRAKANWQSTTECRLVSIAALIALFGVRQILFLKPPN